MRLTTIDGLVKISNETLCRKITMDNEKTTLYAHVSHNNNDKKRTKR